MNITLFDALNKEIEKAISQYDDWYRPNDYE